MGVKMPLYLIEIEYAGPNWNTRQYKDQHWFAICREPLTDLDGVEIPGTTRRGIGSAWIATAHSQHDTIDAARAEMHRLAGPTRQRDGLDENEYNPIESCDPVEVYLVGELRPLCSSETFDYLWKAVWRDVKKPLTPDAINIAAQRYVYEAKPKGIAPDFVDVTKLIQQRVDELLEGAE
jgi:hypothetical protein